MDHLVPLETVCPGSGVATQVTSPCTSGIHPFFIGPLYYGLFDELVDLIECVYYNIFVFKIVFISPNVPFNEIQERETTTGHVKLKTVLNKPIRD